MQYKKGKFMLHHISPVALLHRFGDYVIFDKTSVYKINLKVAVRTVYLWFPQKTADPKAVPGFLKRNQGLCNILPINPVDNLLSVPVSGGMKFYLPVLNKFNRYVRAGQSQKLHHVRHIAAFRLGLF